MFVSLVYKILGEDPSRCICILYEYFVPPPLVSKDIDPREVRETLNINIIISKKYAISPQRPTYILLSGWGGFFFNLKKCPVGKISLTINMYYIFYYRYDLPDNNRTDYQES